MFFTCNTKHVKGHVPFSILEWMGCVFFPYAVERLYVVRLNLCVDFYITVVSC